MPKTTQIEVAGSGELFFADLLMPGRVAHGEAWEWDQLVLKTEVRLDGELILRERFEQTGPELAELTRWSGAGAGACFGNAVLIAGERKEDDAIWQRTIAALHGDGLSIGVSALRRGGWSIKFVAPDGMKLRRALKAIRHALVARYPRLACDPRKL